MITEPRIFYKPFEYQEAFNFYKDQHRVHWLADEVPLASDLNDWKLKYNIRSVPTLVIEVDGQEVKRTLGMQSKPTLINLLNSLK